MNRLAHASLSLLAVAAFGWTVIVVAAVLS